MKLKLPFFRRKYVYCPECGTQNYELWNCKGGHEIGYCCHEIDINGQPLDDQYCDYCTRMDHKK